MKVKEFIERLKRVNPSADVLVSSDEELNSLFSGIEISYLEDKSTIVIFGLSGSEIEE